MVALGFYTTMRIIPRCDGAGDMVGTRPARRETSCGRDPRGAFLYSILKKKLKKLESQD